MSHTLKIQQPVSSTPSLNVLESCGNWVPDTLEKVKVLGSGRAAQAILVKATDRTGLQKTCVEKIFNPGLLTRTIYRCVYQSPFAYQASEDAIQACFYRRKVAAKLLKAFVPDVGIAQPLYVRWDADSSAYVLGAEFVEGRGIRPAPANPERMRRWMSGSQAAALNEDSAEIDELLDVMERTELMLRESGLAGSGWQVCQQAIVSTANLLRTPRGYVVVDLESGIPAMLVAHYVKAGLKIGSLPLFDDVDPAQLRSYLDDRSSQLHTALGADGLSELVADAEKLIQHSVAWKHSEISMFRQGLPFVGRQFQNQYRERCISRWHREEITDDETHQALNQSSRLYSKAIYWAGLLPGKIGRGLQKYLGNGSFRQRVGRFFTKSEDRSAEINQYMERKTEEFVVEGRVADNRQTFQPGLSFAANWMMSKVLPAGVHRWFADRTYRRNRMTRVGLLIVSPRFQREFGQMQIQSVVDKWHSSGRITSDEQSQLLSLSRAHEMDEYARCFGMHLSIKLISPLVFTAKVGGIAAFLATGQWWYLLPVAIAPALRTAITISRMLRSAGQGPAYGEALMVGMLPVVGTLAYPIQVYSSSPKLSTFLIRDTVARLSRMIPIYGGKDSRLEIAAIRAADYPIELIELSLKVTSTIRRWLGFERRDSATTETEAVSYRMSRWDSLAEQQLKLCRAEREQGESITEDQTERREAA